MAQIVQSDDKLSFIISVKHPGLNYFFFVLFQNKPFFNLQKKTKFDFRGFLIKARDAEGNATGTLSTDNGTAWVECSAVTHRDKSFKRHIQAKIKEVYHSEQEKG